MMSLAMTSLKIDGEMTIYKVAELKSLFVKSLVNNNFLEIDLSGVTEFDSSGLQLLVAVKKEAIKKGGDIKLVFHSHSIIEVIDLLDMSSYFGDPLVMPSHINS